MKRSMGRSRLTRLCVAGIVLAGVGVVPVQSALAGESNRSIRATFTGTSSVTLATFPTAYVGDPSRCAPPIGDGGPCVVPVTPTAGFDTTYTGTVQGVGHSAEGFVLSALVAPDPDFDVPYVTWTKVRVTVEGCGTGTFILETRGNLNSPDNRWSVLANSGTDDLAGLSGQGDIHGNEPTDPTVPFVDTFTGRLKCHRD